MGRRPARCQRQGKNDEEDDENYLEGIAGLFLTEEEKNPWFPYSSMTGLTGFASKLRSLISSDETDSKIVSLSSKYPVIREVLSDDNQFYYSFLFAYVENIWINNDTAELVRFTGKLEHWSEQAQDSGLEPKGFADSVRDFVKLVNQILSPETKLEGHKWFLGRPFPINIKPFVLLFSKLAVAARSLSVIVPIELEISSEEKEKDLGAHSNIRAYKELTALSKALELPIHVEVLSEHSPQDFFPETVGSCSSLTSPTATSSTPVNLLYITDSSNGNKAYYHILYSHSFVEKLKALRNIAITQTAQGSLVAVQRFC